MLDNGDMLSFILSFRRTLGEMYDPLSVDMMMVRIMKQRKKCKMNQGGPVLVDDFEEDDGIHNDDSLTEQIVPGSVIMTGTPRTWLFFLPPQSYH